MTAIEAFTGIRYGRSLAIACALAAVAAATWVGSATQTPPALLIPTTGVALIMCAATALYLSRVQIAVNARGLSYRAGAGPWNRFDWNEIATLEHASLPLSAVFGAGIPQDSSTLRHVVGSGPGLHVVTTQGRDIWLSVPTSLTLDRVNTYRTTTPA